MSTKKTSVIEKALLQKGFEQDKTHHRMYWLHVKGKKTGIRTRLSHGKEEYDDNLLAMVARQIKLNKKLFFSYVDCSFTKDQYIQYLIDEKKIKLS